MHKRIILLILIFSANGMLMAQQQVEAGGMIFTAKLVGQRIEIQLEAPTEGWLAVGFNSENNIVGSDLLQFRIEENGDVYAEDQYVTAAGKHPRDIDLGGTDHIQVLSGKQWEGKTKVHFSIPFESGDQFDFQHELGKDFWLILAYSRERDFDHHSIMRKHLAFRWE